MGIARSCVRFSRLASAVSALYGMRPVTSSKKIKPTANRSERPSRSAPIACSGDMYSMVPTMAPTHDVLRLQVAMDDAPAMCGLKCEADLLNDGDRLRRWQFPTLVQQC